MDLNENNDREFINPCEDKYEETKTPAEQIKVNMIVGDLIMRKLISVWSVVSKDREIEDVPLNVWCSLAGLPVSDYNLTKCENLIQLGIVFPGGKIHFWVEQALLREVAYE